MQDEFQPTAEMFPLTHTELQKLGFTYAESAQTIESADWLERPANSVGEGTTVLIIPAKLLLARRGVGQTKLRRFVSAVVGETLVIL